MMQCQKSPRASSSIMFIRFACLFIMHINRCFFFFYFGLVWPPMSRQPPPLPTLCCVQGLIYLTLKKKSYIASGLPDKKERSCPLPRVAGFLLLLSFRKPKMSRKTQIPPSLPNESHREKNVCVFFKQRATLLSKRPRRDESLNRIAVSTDRSSTLRNKAQCKQKKNRKTDTHKKSQRERNETDLITAGAASIFYWNC